MVGVAYFHKVFTFLRLQLLPQNIYAYVMITIFICYICYSFGTTLNVERYLIFIFVWSKSTELTSLYTSHNVVI